MNRRVPLLLCPLLLAGCASDDASFPSLQPRAAERLGFAEPAAPPAGEIELDPALDQAIADASASVSRIQQGFDDAVVRADRQARAAAGHPAGSEAWIEAQTALATLDDWRAQASAVVTDLDQLAIERGTTLAQPYPSLTAAHARATAELDRQTQRIAALSRSLAPA